MGKIVKGIAVSAAAVGFVAVVGTGKAASAATPYTAVGVTGSGAYSNAAGLIIDGVLPPRNTNYAAATNVVWTDPTTTFTIDLGAARTVASLVADLDNNDDYVVQSSVNGTAFTPLFTFLASDGPVQPSPGGLDLLSTDPSAPTSVADATTPVYVGRSFAPVTARYLRISAANGDSNYAVAEVQAFAPVPEPTSVAAIAAAGLGLLGRRRRV